MCSSETWVYFQQTAWHYIPADRTLHNYCCETLKSYIFLGKLIVNRLFKKLIALMKPKGSQGFATGARVESVQSTHTPISARPIHIYTSTFKGATHAIIEEFWTRHFQCGTCRIKERMRLFLPWTFFFNNSLMKPNVAIEWIQLHLIVTVIADDFNISFEFFQPNSVRISVTYYSSVQVLVCLATGP
jgi:hypothetical protein